MTLQTRPMLRLAVDVGAPVANPAIKGARRIPILGGTVAGDYTGTIQPGGADDQMVWPDGRIDISARYIAILDGHGPTEVNSMGVRHALPEILEALARGEDVDPSQYYFRTCIRFLSPIASLGRLNRLIAISTGRREKSQVLLDVFEVL
jgi:hypothetical protein